MNGILARLLDLAADVLHTTAVVARAYANEFAHAQKRVDAANRRPT